MFQSTKAVGAPTWYGHGHTDFKYMHTSVNGHPEGPFSRKYRHTDVST